MGVTLNEDEFRAFYDENIERALDIARRSGALNVRLAADEALLATVRTAPSREALGSFVLLKAQWAARDQLRARNRHARESSLDEHLEANYGAVVDRHTDSPEDVYIRKEAARERLEKALGPLNPIDRTIILRKARGDLSVEIAHATGLTIQALDTRAWRARRDMHQRLYPKKDGPISS